MSEFRPTLWTSWHSRLIVVSVAAKSKFTIDAATGVSKIDIRKVVGEADSVVEETRSTWGLIAIEPVTKRKFFATLRITTRRITQA